MITEEDPAAEPVTDRDVTMAVAHLYRAEMNRMSVWRQRLDVTSNWAVILATALTTFTLGSADVPHYTLLLGLALGCSQLITARSLASSPTFSSRPL